jgi:plastocyanin
MRPVRALLAFGMVLALGVGPVAAADNTSVNIIDLPRVESKWGYAPAARTIALGSWVTWSNNGVDTHSVTAIDGSFDSLDLEPSQGFSWYFDQPGTYQYTCTQHPWMKGTIVVAGGRAVSDQPLAVGEPPAEMMLDDEPAPPTD